MLGKTIRSYHQATIKRTRSDLLLLIGLIFIALITSLHLLSTDCPNGLSAEMILSADSLGINQLPGSSVYLIISKILSWLLKNHAPVKAYALLSLFFTALATMMIYLTGRRLQFPPLVSFSSALIFFFSPFIWNAAIIPHHLSFNLFILTITIYMTIRLFIHSSKRLFDIKAIFWSIGCGLTASQHILFMPWGIGLFILGVGIGFSRHRARGKNYLTSFLVFFATIILTLLYLPWRITSAQVFLNPDFIYQYTSLSNHFFWSRLFAWLTWYLTGGHQPFFLFQSYTSSVVSIWQHVWSFLVSYPFLALVIMMLGLLSNLKTIFLKQQHPTSKSIDNTGRLMLSLLPLIAMGGSAMLLTQLRLPILIGLTIGGAFWSLRALEYCYYQLGQRLEQLSKIKQIKPTLFAIVLILLVPLISFLHTHRSLVQHTRTTLGPSSNLKQVDRLAKQLPKHAVLCLPKSQDSFLFSYAKKVKRLSPSLDIIPFSHHWNDFPYIGPSILHGFSDRGNHAKRHRLTYIDYWSKQIHRLLAENRPVYLLLPAQPPDAVLDYVLQSFKLKPTNLFLNLWYQIGLTKKIHIYQMTRLPLPEKTSYRRQLSKPIGSFDGYLSVSTHNDINPIVGDEQIPLFEFSLNWKIDSLLQEEQLYLQFQILPNGKSKGIKMLDGKKRHWQTLRHLSRGRLLNRIKPGGQFTETYQLAIPAELKPGSYQLQLSIIEPKNKERLTVDTNQNSDNYYLTVLEFFVKSADASLISP